MNAHAWGHFERMMNAGRPHRDWSEDAACKGMDTDTFFPGQGGSYQEAVAVCKRCPVREPCLAYALEWEIFGVWGGETDRGRQRIRGTGRGLGKRTRATQAPGIARQRKSLLEKQRPRAP